jgi:methylmalonyl-CoA mutase N-terminal domain/subunit
MLSNQIADSAYRFQQEVESGTRAIVGVSVHPVEPDGVAEVFKVPVELQREQCAALEARRAARDGEAARQAVAAVAAAVADGRNCMEAMIGAARARATLGEIVGAIGSVVGFHRASQVRL